jgi:hypothetical protein
LFTMTQARAGFVSALAQFGTIVSPGGTACRDANPDKPLTSK